MYYTTKLPFDSRVLTGHMRRRVYLRFSLAQPEVLSSLNYIGSLEYEGNYLLCSYWPNIPPMGFNI